MKYAILETIGENCFTKELGEQLHEKIDGEFVELDFAGVRRFVSIFFDYGIAQLLRDIKPHDFNRLLLVSNLNPVGQQVYNRAIENAKRHYSNL